MMSDILKVLAPFVGVVTAVASIVVSLVSIMGTRSNQRDIEQVKAELAERKSEADAKRAYRYDALKRLYGQYEPIRFQLVRACDSANQLIVQLVEISNEQDKKNRAHFPGDEYFRIARVYQLLLPAAYFRILEKSLTLVDLEASDSTFLQYLLARLSYELFVSDRDVADFFGLEYSPSTEDGKGGNKLDPSRHCKQGLTAGVLDNVLASFVNTSSDQALSLLSFGEFEELLKSKSLAQQDGGSPLGAAVDLLDEFVPNGRPVLWRILLSQLVVHMLFIRAVRSNVESIDDLRRYADEFAPELSTLVSSKALANGIVRFVKDRLLDRIDRSFKTPYRLPQRRGSPVLVVLIHGGHAGAWVWSRVRSELTFPSLAVDLPAHGRREGELKGLRISDCVDAVFSELPTDRSIILVSHSEGTAVALGLVNRLQSRLAHLVVIAGPIPALGKSTISAFPLTERLRLFGRALWHLNVNEDIQSRKSAKATLLNGLPSAMAEETMSRFTNESISLLRDPVYWTPASVPATYICCRRDRGPLSPARQNAMAARLGANVSVVSIDTCHYAMLEKPVEVASVLNAIAGRAADNKDLGAVTFRCVVADQGTFYVVTNQGDLLWYKDLKRDGTNASDGSTGWDARSGNQIGAGWDVFSEIVSGGDGVIYGIKASGELSWYRDVKRDGTNEPDGSTGWHDRSGNVIGAGWNRFSRVFSGGDGVIYGINRTGALVWHKDIGGGNPAWDAKTGSQIGLGWNRFSQVFAGVGGIIYAIKPTGELLWFKDMKRDGTNAPDASTGWDPESGKQIGVGWNVFSWVFSGGDGMAYGIKPTGELLWFSDALRRDATISNAESGSQICLGWVDARQ